MVWKDGRMETKLVIVNMEKPTVMIATGRNILNVNHVIMNYIEIMPTIAKLER